MSRWLSIGLLAFLPSCLMGCKTHGHREVTVELFGSKFVVKDQTFTDDTGKQDYTATFDEVGQLILGWLKPEPEKEPETPVGTGEDGG